MNKPMVTEPTGSSLQRLTEQAWARLGVNVDQDV